MLYGLGFTDFVHAYFTFIHSFLLQSSSLRKGPGTSILISTMGHKLDTILGALQFLILESFYVVHAVIFFKFAHILMEEVCPKMSQLDTTWQPTWWVTIQPLRRIIHLEIQSEKTTVQIPITNTRWNDTQFQETVGNRTLNHNDSIKQVKIPQVKKHFASLLAIRTYFNIKMYKRNSFWFN